MSKAKHIIFTSIIATVIYAAIPSFAAEPPKKEPPRNFHGMQSGDLDALFALEKLCPKMIKEWVITKDLHSQIPALYATFGTKKRSAAEKKANMLAAKLNMERHKYSKLYNECDKNLEAKLNSVTKKIDRLEKKKKLSTSDEKKLEKLEQTASDIRDSINAMERLKPSSYTFLVPSPIQRLGISAGELAGEQIVENAPKLIALRMSVQDYVTDIENVRKNKDQRGAANLEKQLLAKLKITYLKTEKEATAYKKKLNMQLTKSQKELDKLEKKVAQLEKSNRNTDKYDKKRLILMGDIRTINFQIQLVDQLLACPKAKKMLNIK